MGITTLKLQNETISSSSTLEQRYQPTNEGVAPRRKGSNINCIQGKLDKEKQG